MLFGSLNENGILYCPLGIYLSLNEKASIFLSSNGMLLFASASSSFFETFYFDRMSADPISSSLI